MSCSAKRRRNEKSRQRLCGIPDRLGRFFRLLPHHRQAYLRSPRRNRPPKILPPPPQVSAPTARRIMNRHSTMKKHRHTERSPRSEESLLGFVAQTLLPVLLGFSWGFTGPKTL